jgi:vitamin B12 transporter
VTIIRVAIVAAIAPMVSGQAALAAAATDPPASQLIVHIEDPAHASIEHARVALYARDRIDARRGISDRDGKCLFADLAAGTYFVDVEVPGFITPDASRVSLEPGTSRDLVLTLALGGFEFETHVVVTSSDAIERRADVSKALSVVDRHELDARDVFTASDAIRTLPALRVEQLGGPGSQTSIRLRGLRSQDTAILIDGVSFRDASATQGDATSFVSDLLLTNVDRVEVLRGSGSDLYGSNAIGGAVNVITRAGGQPASRDALFEGGGLGLVRGRGQVGGGTADNRLTYSGGVSALHVADGIDGDDRAWNTSLQGRMTARVKRASVSALAQAARAFTAMNATPLGTGTTPASTTATALALSADQLRLYERGAPLARLDVGTATFIPSANDPDSTRRSDSSVVLAQLSYPASDRIVYAASYQRVSTSRRFENGPQGIGFQPAGMSRSTFDGRIDTVRLRSDLSVGGGQILTAAYQLEREAYLSAAMPVTAAAPSTVDVSEWNHAASVQDRVSMLDGSLQLNGGFRAQAFSLHAPLFSPEISAPYRQPIFQSPPSAYTADGSAAYRLSASGTKLRVHAGNGYREPSLFERFGTSFGSRGYSIYGDPRLAPERSFGIDAGIDQDVAGQARVSVSAFTTHLEQAIVFDSSGAIDRAIDLFGRGSGYRTIPGGRKSGLEVTTRARPVPSLVLTGSYTFSAEASSEGPGGPSLMFGWPRHQTSLEALARLGTRVQMAALAALSSSYLAPLSDAETFASRTYRFDGLRRVDLSVSYTAPFAGRRRLRMFGRIDNVTKQTYFESGFRTPGRVAAAGVGIEF